MAYKTLYPEGYYRKNWNRLFEKYRNHMDLEKELDWFTSKFEELPEDLREQAKMATRKNSPGGKPPGFFLKGGTKMGKVEWAFLKLAIVMFAYLHIVYTFIR